MSGTPSPSVSLFEFAGGVVFWLGLVLLVRVTIVGEPLLVADEVSGETPVGFEDEYHESVTWTFYKFATRKGYVDVRWLGESNGYYSESVDLGYEKV